jgi:hypothetical protein
MVRIEHQKYPMFIGLGTMVRIQRGYCAAGAETPKTKHRPSLGSFGPQAKLQAKAAPENPGYPGELNLIKPN